MGKELPGGFRSFLWQRLWPERDKGHLLRGHPVRGCTGLEGADKNTEKEATYGDGGSKPNGM